MTIHSTMELIPFDFLADLLPTQGWLGDYLTFTKNLEACDRFRFFSAACAIGAAVNNKVWIQRGNEGLLPKLFPNIWIILLAPPGRGHKTSTINMATNCLYEACPQVRMLADKLTPESLVKCLSTPVGENEVIRIGPRDATGLIKAPELAVFFGKQQYNTGLVSLITDLYDYREEWVTETIMRGRNVLRNICISIIGGSTPDWLQKMLPEDAFTGGFMSRFVIVEMPAQYFKRIAYPHPLGDKGWTDLVHGLAQISNLHGEMRWTPDCADYYQNYYENLRPSGDIQKDAYQEREAEQILRIAMLLALSELRMFITSEDFKLAQKIINSLMEETTPRIEKLTTHPRMVLVQELQTILQQVRKITHRNLLKRVYRSLSNGEAQFQEAIRILKMTGDIDTCIIDGVPGYISLTESRKEDSEQNGKSGIDLGYAGEGSGSVHT